MKHEPEREMNGGEQYLGGEDLGRKVACGGGAAEAGLVDHVGKPKPT